MESLGLNNIKAKRFRESPTVQATVVFNEYLNIH